MIFIQKRDGTVVPFNKQKIIDAINKAFLEIDGKIYENDTVKDIADEIYHKAKLFYKKNSNTIELSEDATIFKNFFSVENIQDLVEELLMRSERTDVARSYIRYRYKKEVARNYEHDFINAIKEKLNASNI